jgi:hypothetical protein
VHHPEGEAVAEEQIVARHNNAQPVVNSLPLLQSGGDGGDERRGLGARRLDASIRARELREA